MLSKNTTLVIGAGASIPYGFPSGCELVQEIAGIERNQGLKDLFLKARISKNELNQFVMCLRKSGRLSIDSFLSARYADYGEIGKAAIAGIISQHEYDSKLFHPATIPKSWLNIVASYLHAPTISEFVENCKRVTFVTYNYDRLIEQYFYRSIESNYTLKGDDALDVLRQLSIHHLHGSLGSIDPRDSTYVPFGGVTTPERLTKSAKNIKIISENGVGNSVEFDKARADISHSQSLCFLGFGFHDDNLKRLQLMLSYGINYFATVKGLGPAELERLEILFRKRLQVRDCDCLDIFSRMNIFLMEYKPVFWDHKSNLPAQPEGLG